MADQAQRSRSVYIGNLPWDVKEDELKKIFSQVGTIVSLRMPVDPESQRSRGFAFCEFREQDSVNVAIKHFNAYELNGRKIRVDSAANNADKDAKTAGPFFNEHQYGEVCDPVKAPETIANVIGSMSPEQVHAIICEAKRCLQGDPQEARVALINNPQLTYALLLALVRGRCISKERGTEALVKPEPPLLPLFPEGRAPLLNSVLPGMHMSQQMPIPAMAQPMQSMGTLGSGPMQAGVPPMYGPSPILPLPQPRGGPPPRQFNDPPQNPRHYNNEAQGGPQRQQPGQSHDRGPSARNFNNESQPGPYSRPFNESTAQRSRSGMDGDRREIRGARYEPTERSPVTRSPQVVTPPPASVTASREEQEKAELIMQVLKLKEEDIAKMAPEQQRTVRTLRDQFKSINK